MADKFLHQIPRIREGMDFLLTNDPVFKKLGILPESMTWRYMEPGFGGLIRIVIGQQVSTAAAATMWKRFDDAVPRASHNAVLGLTDDEMRALGLSSQKARYIRGLAQAVKDKTFDPKALGDLSDEEVTLRITALNGFGSWSAQMYLMFALARPDVWSSGDLGIREGLRRYKKLAERPTIEEAEKMGKKFAPHRTAASILLWYLAGQKENPVR